MGFFDWSAPLFGHFADRWSEADRARIASRLRPHVPEGGRIADIGGGTGALAVHLADALGAAVIVVDPTPRMLRYVPERPDVVPLLGTAEELPFENASFDAVVVSDAFHHFRDQDRAVREFQRVLRPGGAVLLLEWDASGFFGPVLVTGERLLGEPGAFFSPEQLCAFMAGHELPGHCEKTHGISYYFLGYARQR